MKASFDIEASVAIEFLNSPGIAGACNSDVVKPWANGMDLTRRSRDMWIIDFGNSMPLEDAARHEAPFENVRRVITPQREGRREARIAENIDPATPGSGIGTVHDPWLVPADEDAAKKLKSGRLPLRHTEKS